ncbi:MAG: bifunctional oligoribonuclease/PAP phosphatase NrnA [Akkermansia sp.]|nr:bifunctional oligoribonuclease/PAP phosphatase NrnA [Akkermansia sp.]
MFSELIRTIQENDSFVVVSHFRPDGDAIGSTIALGLMLQSLGKKVQMWNNDPAPRRYAFLDGWSDIRPVPSALPDDVQVFICVDTGDIKRIGNAAMDLFSKAPFTINIDHHHTNTRYAGVNVVEGNAAACGCIIHRLIREMGVELTRPMAEALYAAISTDTGSFQYGSTTAEVMRIAAELIEAGVDVGNINRCIYQEVPSTSFIVQREVLNNMVVEENGTISHFSMPAGRKEELGVGPEDTKDLVDIIRVMQGVKVAVIFEELGDGLVRVSLRSKDPQVDVSAIAGMHGGGGHYMASGIRMRGPLAHAREQVLNSIRAVIRSLS